PPVLSATAYRNLRNRRCQRFARRDSQSATAARSNFVGRLHTVSSTNSQAELPGDGLHVRQLGVAAVLDGSSPWLPVRHGFAPIHPSVHLLREDFRAA